MRSILKQVWDDVKGAVNSTSLGNIYAYASVAGVGLSGGALTYNLMHGVSALQNVPLAVGFTVSALSLVGLHVVGRRNRLYNELVHSFD